MIPDELSLGLLWLGLILNTANYFTSPASAIIGAATGYLILWLVMQIYRLITGKIGMGHGDFKLLAAIGAWLGWHLLPFVLLIAAFTATIITLIRICLRATTRDNALAFGPYLALSAVVVLFFGNIAYYLIGAY